jgi:hypothetical protein
LVLKVKRPAQHSQVDPQKSTSEEQQIENVVAATREAAGAFDRLADRIRDDAARRRNISAEPHSGVVAPRNPNVFQQRPISPPEWIRGLLLHAEAKPKPAKLTKHESKILPIAARGLRGMAYCRELENAFVRPRPDWIKRGCPRSYPAAYRDLYWRQMIQDEKAKTMRKAASH